MPERQDLEALLLDNLSVVERIAAAICRRHGLSPEDAEDFTASVKARLVEDDYVVLRKFRGESSLATYLAVVVAMLFRDYRTRHWGRWRPSAVAQSLGPAAVRLETLVYRDGYSLDQATAVLRSAGPGAGIGAGDLSPRALSALYARLPARGPMRPVDVGPEPLLTAVGVAGADDLLLAHLAAEERQRLEGAVQGALEQLPAEDRLIVRMRYWEGLRIADIARALQLPQKALYRRVERALIELRRHLESSGVSRNVTQQMFADEGWGN